jgi:NAD(P)-dependent dehydrogenase (short-subunit alcohol dehydrogenase family)
MQDFSGSGAIVTGGASGLGAATAGLLASSVLRVNTIEPSLFPTPLLHDLPREEPASLGYLQQYAETVLPITRNKMPNGETIWMDGAIRMAPR